MMSIRRVRVGIGAGAIVDPQRRLAGRGLEVDLAHRHAVAWIARPLRRLARPPGEAGRNLSPRKAKDAKAGAKGRRRRCSTIRTSSRSSYH
jgi:hypothetical protein